MTYDVVSQFNTLSFASTLVSKQMWKRTTAAEHIFEQNGDGHLQYPELKSAIDKAVRTAAGRRAVLGANEKLAEFEREVAACRAARGSGGKLALVRRVQDAADAVLYAYAEIARVIASDGDKFLLAQSNAGPLLERPKAQAMSVNQRSSHRQKK